MATDELYEEFGGGEDIYDDVAPTPYNGHAQSYAPPTMPQPRPEPKYRPEPKSRTLPPGRGAPVIPSRAPTTSLSHQTLQNKPPAQQDKKKGKPKKETKQAPPPPVNTSGGLDMKEILRKRQTINTNKFEDLEKSKKDDDDGEKLAPWQLEKKRGGPNRSSIVLNESKTKANDDDEPEFIKKRRSMSFKDIEDETPLSPPPVASKPSAPIIPIKEEPSPPLKPVVNPKPKPTPRPKPGPANSPPFAPKPKPAPPSRKDSLPNSSSNPPSPSTRPAFEKSVKPPVAIPPKPGSSPHTERRSNKPPLPEEDLPPPPFKPPPPSESPPTIKARPPIANRPPTNVNPSSGKPGESPPLAQHQMKSSPVLPPKPFEGLPPKPPQLLPPKPSENATPTFKPPAPLPPVQSVAEPTPIAPSVLKYRRLPLPLVDINNPPPLPSRALKPSTGFTSKRPPLIPTESQDIDEDIYDDTLAVTGDNDGEDIYDDTMAVTSEVEPLNEEDEEIYDDVAVGDPPPSLPSRPPKLPPIPSTPPPASSAPPIRSPPPTLPVPPIPLEEEQEDYEEPSKLQNPGASPNMHHDHGNLPPVPPSPHSRSTLPLPPTQQTTPSPCASPTMKRRSLTKEEKKQLKEDERRAREQKRLDLLKEKEMRKREEQKTRNRQKSMKTFKDYKLPDYIQPLFSIEILSNKKASKNHMSVVAGERMSVLLIAHDNLPRGQYLVEKEDGTIGLVDEHITERTVYQSAQQLGIQLNSDNFGYGDNEDIYEAVEVDVDVGNPPSLPPMNSHTIPQEDEDPQDVYECLPEN